MTYELTLHAELRVSERQVTPDEILCARGCGAIRIIDAALAAFYDAYSRLVVLVNVEYRRIVTVWRV